MKTKASTIQKSVAAVLMAHWDPIGIKDVGEARDEYDQYVRKIANDLMMGASDSALSAYLLHVEKEELGLVPDPNRSLLVADILKKLEFA